jgi:hypothetical protein
MTIEIEVYKRVVGGKSLGMHCYTLDEEDIIRLFQHEMINQGYADIRDEVTYDIQVGKVIID